MRLRTFQDLLSRRPFQPFRLVMNSGLAFDVARPEMALLTRSDLLVGVGASGDGSPLEYESCSLSHVASVEPLRQAAGGA